LLLADAHPNMLAAVRGLLVERFAATVMVADEPSLLEAVGRMEPDLVVVDLSLPVSGDVNVVRTLFSRYPGLRVIVLSVHDEQTALSQALGAGAAGFVLKRTAVIDLTAAADAVLRGETYVSGAMSRRPGGEAAPDTMPPSTGPPKVRKGTCGDGPRSVHGQQ
jgi:DNA-binding NarL/FixJ family response regulator